MPAKSRRSKSLLSLLEAGLSIMSVHAFRVNLNINILAICSARSSIIATKYLIVTIG